MKLRYKFMVAVAAILAVELLLHLAIPNIDINIHPGQAVMISDRESKVHRWVGGEIAYVLIPNSSSGGISINSEGFRDREYVREKREGTYRIAVLGDSVTFGWGIGMNDTFPKRLEDKLNTRAEPSLNYEVLNFGVSGYYANQETELFKDKVVDFDPDLVIFALVVNDLGAGSWGFIGEDGELYHVQQSYAYTPAMIGSDPINSILMNSRIYEISNIALFRMAGDRLPFSYYSKFSHDDIKLRFKEAKRLADERNITLRIVIIPKVVDYGTYGYTSIHRDIREVAGSAGIGSHDMLYDIKGYDYRQFRIDGTDDFHYNAYGNDVLAEKLMDYLIGEGLINLSEG